MGTSIKLDDRVVDDLRRDAQIHNRSLAEQAAHYINIGRAIERSPDFSHDRIEAALTGGMEVGELSAEEQAKFFVDYKDWIEQAQHPESFYANRRRLGLGVGANDDGSLIYQREVFPHATLN